MPDADVKSLDTPAASPAAGPGFTELVTDWQAHREAFEAQKAEALARRRDYMEKIAAIRDKKPESFGGHLKRAFDSVTRVPWMKFRIRGINCDARHRLSLQENKARDLYNDLGGLVMNGAAADPMKGLEYNALQETRGTMKEVLGLIESAASACDTAESLENSARRGARRRNVFATMAVSAAAAGQRRLAAGEVGKAAEALVALRGKIGDIHDCDSHAPADMDWRGQVDGFLQRLAEGTDSLRGLAAAEGTETAARQLREIAKDIRAMDVQVQKNAFTLVHAQLGAPEADPEVQKFAADLRRHMPMALKPGAASPAVAVTAPKAQAQAASPG